MTFTAAPIGERAAIGERDVPTRERARGLDATGGLRHGAGQRSLELGKALHLEPADVVGR